MKPKIGMSEIHLKRNIDLLSIILSDEMTLYIKTRKFHWNVAGESFMELHKLFEIQYVELEVIIDEVAERISKLGGKTIGTMNEFTLLTRIVEHPNKYPVKSAMISELLSDHEMIISELRKDIDVCVDVCHDAGSADLLTGILQQHESIAWILRRYLS
ncbi:Dps family protein [Flavobacterium psychrophilum]|uniref:Dps family protein n=1 Tax=Flavobacterium psychrophilum TaxID=96345 RepID=UPI00090C84CD|nr:DNA starvation/stationary phase protection protein [Flavobacterium psychrophilum]EKT2072605.1 DNA starvation/stationary phase protection protein [Flavobacterium psychrophilum]EKT4492118.1 DNA starvation/stationary phase protection protein [Flavobacterium psychrophilum]SHH93268.1 DPS (DNA Protecting protein under Starved conditions) domain family protein [Flavobacterium psychrophilum]